MTEHYIEQHCRAIAITRGAILLKLRPPPVGVPDRLLVYKGATIFVELKTPQGRLRKGQGEMHRQLRARGARVEIIRSSLEFRALLDELETGV